MPDEWNKRGDREHPDEKEPDLPNKIRAISGDETADVIQDIQRREPEQQEIDPATGMPPMEGVPGLDALTLNAEAEIEGREGRTRDVKAWDADSREEASQDEEPRDNEVERKPDGRTAREERKGEQT